MTTRQEYYPHEEKTRSKDEVLFEAHHRMPDGKLIVTMQTCHHCGRTFQPRRGRKHCPCCKGLLRTKTMILQLP